MVLAIEILFPLMDNLIPGGSQASNDAGEPGPGCYTWPDACITVCNQNNSYAYFTCSAGNISNGGHHLHNMALQEE